MGEEKLDNTVYTIRGLRDLADLATSKGDTATQTWATARAAATWRRLRGAWWFGAYSEPVRRLSRDAGATLKVFQRHWIGLTPIEAELVRPGQVAGPLASVEHGQLAVAKREEPCYSDEFGLYHTGTGDSFDRRQPGAHVRLRRLQRRERALHLLAQHLDHGGGRGHSAGSAPTSCSGTPPPTRAYSSIPGCGRRPATCRRSPPSLTSSPTSTPVYDRSMALQAWGTYGILWPVVHYQLGVSAGPRPRHGVGRAAGRRRARAGSPVPTSGWEAARST